MRQCSTLSILIQILPLAPSDDGLSLLQHFEKLWQQPLQKPEPPCRSQSDGLRLSPALHCSTSEFKYQIKPSQYYNKYCYIFMVLIFLSSFIYKNSINILNLSIVLMTPGSWRCLDRQHLEGLVLSCPRQSPALAAFHWKLIIHHCKEWIRHQGSKCAKVGSCQ